MEVIIVEREEDVATIAADRVQQQIHQKRDSVLGLATGGTPLRLYDELASRVQKKSISFAAVSTFNLDEYVGLPPDHRQSYAYYMDKHLFSRIDIDREKTFLPSCPDRKYVTRTCEDYEQALRASGGIDLQILGIGANGHIGFNEPTSSLRSSTRVKTLTEQTVRDNSRFFRSGEEQPSLAITMGIGTILKSKRALLIATGNGKATALAQAIEGPLSAMCPASALQLHPNATFVIDIDAASRLSQRAYYLWVMASKERLERSAEV